MVRITDNYLGCRLRLGAVVANLVACVAIAVNKDMFIAWHPSRCDSLQDDPAWCFLPFCLAPLFSYLAPLPARVLWQTS
ncbi:hypothetical protein B0T13DRAFT_474806 [Neurospora crassa]|nr:hypothetical protein B0T13DRAFT_474806 [Neurospora crassa]